MLRRFLGGTDLVTSDVYFHPDREVRVIWTYHESTEAGPIIERLWLSAIYFGSVLTNFNGYPDLQVDLHEKVMQVAKQFATAAPDEVKSIPIPYFTYRLIDSSNSPVSKHYQTVLYRNRGDSLVNRDKAPFGEERLFAPLSVLAILASNQRDLSVDDLRFFGTWLGGMSRFYQQRSYSSFGSSAYATLHGYQIASEIEAQRTAVLRGKEAQ